MLPRGKQRLRFDLNPGVGSKRKSFHTDHVLRWQAASAKVDEESERSRKTVPRCSPGDPEPLGTMKMLDRGFELDSGYNLALP